MDTKAITKEFRQRRFEYFDALPFSIREKIRYYPREVPIQKVYDIYSRQGERGCLWVLDQVGHELGEENKDESI